MTQYKTLLTRAAKLPKTWSLTENIAWKTPLPSWSGGSPVIWGDRIFVTSPSQQPPEAAGTESGGGKRHPGGPKLLLLCISKKDGSILWKQELDEGNELHRNPGSLTGLGEAVAPLDVAVGD